jgi:hypothetical protein
MTGHEGMRCLMITPVPMRPETQGNAVAIARLCRTLKGMGFELHVVYSAMEGIDQRYLRQMIYDCDVLDVLPYPGFLSRPDSLGYSLDDWFDPKVSDHITELCRIWTFDLAIVHYVWMSAAANAIPKHIPKILFTHDRFADRHLTLARAGIAPAWYSISKHDEAKGFNRFDFIISVTSSETDDFRKITSKPIFTFGMFPNRVRRPKREYIRNRIPKVGYFGSSNPSNVRSLLRFTRAIESNNNTRPPIEIVIAGPICHTFSNEFSFIKKIGILENLDDLYKSVDFVVNPEAGGTGLRMKTLEILAADVPLLATREAMSGLAPQHPLHMLANPEELARAVCTQFESNELNTLLEAGRDLIDQFVEQQSITITRLIQSAIANYS